MFDGSKAIAVLGVSEWEAGREGGTMGIGLYWERIVDLAFNVVRGAPVWLDGNIEEIPIFEGEKIFMIASGVLSGRVDSEG